MPCFSVNNQLVLEKMMIKVLIIDDDERQLNTISAKVTDLGYLVAGSFSSSVEALSALIECDPDVILLDINLSKDDEGILLATEIQKKSNIPIIFITSMTSSDVINRVVGVNPSGYLVKPIDTYELKAGIELAFKKSQSNFRKEYPKRIENQDYLTIRVGQKLKKISFNEITHLKVESKNYVVLVDKNKKKLVVRESLKQILDTVLPSSFQRTHNSYGVNLSYVEFIDERSQQVYLTTGEFLPMGRAFRENIYSLMNIR